MFPSSFRAAIIVGLAFLVAAPAFAKRGVSMRPDRVARRHATKLMKMDKQLPLHGYNQPIMTKKLGSTRIAQGRDGTAVVFKDGSWGLIGRGGIQIYTPKRSSLTPSSPKAILKGIERRRLAARDRTLKPERLGPPKGVTQRSFSHYKLALRGTERTNLDGSTMRSGEVTNAIPNTPYNGKEFNTLSRNLPWKLISHSSSGTQWSAKQKTTQKRDKLGRWLKSDSREGAVPRKKAHSLSW
jgi:hypothetical protein